jgi:hypothetical protein
MLVATKTLEYHLGKSLPGAGFEMGFNRLFPTSNIMFAVHGGDLNPFEWLNRVEIKVILTVF